METVLIFGATGTVGANTALDLKSKGYNVIAVGRRKSDNNFFKDYGIGYYSVDISKKEDFSSLETIKINSIVHCAGAMPATMKDFDPQQYIDSIVTGTLNILNFALRMKVDKIIFTHTRADSSYLMGTKTPVPSDIERKFPLKGDHSIYTICKNAAVNLIEHYYHEYGLRRFILRLPTIYAYQKDPYYYVNGEKKWMAYRFIMQQAINGERIEIWGNPNKEKEIVYIKDLCQLIEKCIESPIEGGVYNVGRGVGVTIESQIKGIVEVFSEKNNISEVVYKPEMPDSRQFIHDISKTKSDLGYEPKYDYMNLLLDFKNEMQINRFAKLWS